MSGRRLAESVFLLTVVAVSAAVAGEPDWYYLHPDSLFAPGRQAEPYRLPTNKLFYLEQKYGLCPSQRHTDDPESLNVRMVGKWGGGPSWGVTGMDTLVYLSRGSEVVVINFADTANPEILNHIQAKRLAGRPVLVDSLLYLATSGYVEVFNVADPTNAPRVGRLSVPVADIDVEDSLVYVIGADTFMVWSFADPQNPWLVGACRDSGYALDVDRGYAYLRDRWGMYILDATDPASPHRIGSWGTDVAGVKVRGNHCYAAQGSMGSGSLHVLNVADPANPWQEGVLSGLTAEGICLLDTLLFTPGFDVVNIADSSRPRPIASEPAGGGEVWVHDSLRYGVTAGWTGGLRVLNLENIADPVLDTTMLGTYSCVDISVRDGIACVASQEDYIRLLDVTDPTSPAQVGRYAANTWFINSVLNTGPIAYVPAYASTHDTVLHAVDISDPSSPVMAGAVGGWEGPYAMAIQDSFLYAAEPYRFEVFSVANPRQPVWRGRCNLQEAALDVVVRDSLAYVACLPSAVINIADPSNPTVIGTISSSAYGIAVYDIFAYLAVNYGGLKIWSIADPAQPYRIDTIAYTRGYEVEVAESLLLYGGLDFRVLDLATPALPVEVGSYETPYRTRKIACDGQYVYTACFMAGVCVLEYHETGLADGRRALPHGQGHAELVPNPTRGVVRLMGGPAGDVAMHVYDASGKEVTSKSVQQRPNGRRMLDLTGLPAGLYFVEVRSGTTTTTRKVVRQ